MNNDRQKNMLFEESLDMLTSERANFNKIINYKI